MHKALVHIYIKFVADNLASNKFQPPHHNILVMDMNALHSNDQTLISHIPVLPLMFRLQSHNT